MCSHKDKRPLHYYYDEGWGSIGPKVFLKAPVDNDDDYYLVPLQLEVCMACGQVFALRTDNKITED